MRKPMWVLAAVVVCACGGGGGNNTAGPNDNNSNANVTVSTPGQPTDSEWASLAAELSGIAADAAQKAVGAAHHTAPALEADALMGLSASRASAVSFSGNYYCCGKDVGTGSYVSTTGELGDPSGGTRALTERLSSNEGTRWRSSDGRTTWSVQLPDGLRMTSSLAVVGDTIGSAQSFRVVGTITYRVAGGELKTEAIDVQLSYANLQSSPPTATGQIGPVRLSGGALPSTPRAGRCSLPREGCGPTVNGNAPCTAWPLCGL